MELNQRGNMKSQSERGSGMVAGESRSDQRELEKDIHILTVQGPIMSRRGNWMKYDMNRKTYFYGSVPICTIHEEGEFVFVSLLFIISISSSIQTFSNAALYIVTTWVLN